MECDICIGQTEEQKNTLEMVINDGEDGNGDSDQAIGKKLLVLCVLLVHVLHNNHLDRHSLDIS